MGSADALLENRVASLKPSKAPGNHLDFRTKAGAQCLGDTGKSSKSTAESGQPGWPQAGRACIPPADPSCLSLSDPYTSFPPKRLRKVLPLNTRYDFVLSF